MKKIFLFCIFIVIKFHFLEAQPRQHFSEIPLFINGTHGYACYRIPAIIKAPNGNLLAFAEGRVNNCHDFGNVDILLRKSHDNGISWSEPQVVASNGKLQAGNPAPVVDALDPKFAEGRIFLFYNTGTNSESETRKGNGLREVWYITSTDHGNTWSKPTNITASVHRPNQPSQNAAYQFSEDWRTYANTPGHAIQLVQGDFRGRIFVPANHSEGPPQEGFNDYRAHAFFSDDHGKTWQISASINVPSSNESHAVELSDGRVLQNIRHQNGSQRERLIAISSDGGSTWDTTYFDSQLPSPVCQASLHNYTTPSGVKVLLFSNPNSKTHRKNMTVRVSFDDGKTWILSRVVREGESAYSDLVVQDNNAIGLLYEHGNDDGIHFANFNFEWLANGKNHTDHPLVSKVMNRNDPFAKSFQFELASPIIKNEKVFFENKNDVKLLLDFEGTTIHYTTDGSEPNELSPLFSDLSGEQAGKITLTESTTLKAKAFHPQCLPSQTVKAQFFKLGAKLPIKNISINRSPHENYPGKGATGLVDRTKGTTNFRTSEWMGFSGGDLEILIELEEKTDLKKITASMLLDQQSWIFLPDAIQVFSSKNGKDFQLIESSNFDRPSPNAPSGCHFLEVKFSKEKMKYLKIILKNIPAIPDWHPGKGTPAWLFIDEILLD